MFANIGNLGTALAGGFRGFNQQQEQEQAKRLAAARLDLYAREADNARKLQQVKNALGLAAQSGGLNFNQPVNLPGGTAPPVPGYPQPPMPGTGSVSNQAKGPAPAGFTGPTADYIREGAISRGLSPDDAARTVMSEGGVGQFLIGDSGTSGGPFQLHVRGNAPGTRVAGLGDDFRAKTGLDPLDPKNEKAGIDFALDYAKSRGGFPVEIWHGLRRAGAADPARAKDSGNYVMPNRPPPPQGWTISNFARELKKADPSLDGESIFMAIEQFSPLMDKQSQHDWERYKFAVGEQDKDRQFGLESRRLDESAADRRERMGMEHERLGLEKGRLDEEKRFHDMSSGKGRASKNVEVTDAQGNKVFSGAAHQLPDGSWVNDATGQPVNVPDDGSIKIAGAGGPGRQAQTAILRVTAAGNELAAAAKNLVDLPIGATAGMFSGLQGLPPDQMKGAFLRSLANKVTPEDAQAILVSFQGVARAVAQLEAVGAAQGLVGLTKTAQVLMPLEGDSAATVLRKYAELRQIAERAMETMASAPDVGNDQKKLLAKITKEVEEAVPWTVGDVNRITRNPTDESVKEFARKVGASGAPRGGRSQPSSQTAPAEENLPTVDINGRITR